MLKKYLGIVIVALCLTGLFALPLSGAVVVQGIRTDSVPVIDGKLIDNCWQKAVPMTNFLYINSNNPATTQTIGYVLFDDSNLYIGMKCLEPNISNIKTGVRKYESEVFRDDIVEIMIAPFLSKTDYFQFAVNASGSKFDCSRREGGTVEDDSWNGEWEAASFIGDNYWSCEVSIPYYTLGVTSIVGSEWGINLCREKQEPRREYSSIGETGVFNVVEKFAKLEGIEVNFKEYCYRIGDTKILDEIKDNNLYIRLIVPIMNESVIEKRVKIERLIIDKSGRDSIKSEEVAFKANEEKDIPLELLDIEPVSKKKPGKYYISEPETKKITIMDIENKRIFAVSNIKKLVLYIAMEVKVINPKDIELEIKVNISEEKLKDKNLSIEIGKLDEERVLLKKEITSPGTITRVKFLDEEVGSGKLIARAIIKDKKGEEIVEANTTFVRIEGEVKRLNNLVMELVNVKREATKEGYNEYKFENPRDGWVFISTTADIKGKGKALVSIDSMAKEKPIIVHEKSGVGTLEAMRLLSAGEHKVKVWSEGKASLSLIVRAIPELLFRGFRGGPPTDGYEPSDYWEFLQKYVVKNVNCMICGSGGFVNNPGIMSIVEEWKKQGKKWMHECGVPGAINTPVGDITADKAYAYWSSQPSFQFPILDGVIADEFLGRFPMEKYGEWTKAVRMLYDNEKFRDKTFYAYFGGGTIYSEEHLRRFVDAVMEGDYKIAWERYLPEQPTESEADKFLKSEFRQYILNWENEQPGCREKMVMVIGCFGGMPIMENTNLNPSVDHKVYIDMQFNLMANDPAFSGLYGVEQYSSAYAEEEDVRWASELFRHYCLEGKKEMLSKKYGFKYMLKHVQNPDFDNGKEGWETRPAEDGSISTKNMQEYGWLQGRFPKTPQGDNFLWMKRNNKKPNVISQEIKNLEPGKLYSLKTITADYNDITEGKSEKKKHAVSINIDDVELVPNKCFQEIRGSIHHRGPFSDDDSHRAWMNYHWKVFRAKGESAKLTITDWINDKEQGGPINQELIFNFIEVQPYFE
ncbi:MAG: hypothetical protein HY606_10610 [Planctomycetes bacterium]|nr:hypothetical protein [Planctomycetota bacterium]